jgi:hypothetical protein
MNLSEAETQYILNVVMKQPLIEALPLFLKLTQQRLAPEEAKLPVTGIKSADANTAGRP